MLDHWNVYLSAWEWKWRFRIGSLGAHLAQHKNLEIIRKNVTRVNYPCAFLRIHFAWFTRSRPIPYRQFYSHSLKYSFLCTSSPNYDSEDKPLWFKAFHSCNLLYYIPFKVHNLYLYSSFFAEKCTTFRWPKYHEFLNNVQKWISTVIWIKINSKSLNEIQIHLNGNKIFSFIVQRPY